MVTRLAIDRLRSAEPEIAAIVDKSEANSRQIGRRARTRVGEPLRRFRPTHEKEHELLSAFVAATEAGDVDALTGLLARDAILWTDGGGKVSAALQPLDGAERIARFLLAIARKAPAELRSRPVRVNGDPGMRTDAPSGPAGVLALELAEEEIVGIRIVVNPDKLRHLATTDARRGRPSARRFSARLARLAERYVLNPQMRLGLVLGLAPRAFALLETIGRRSGKPRHTPIGNGLLGNTFWLVSEHGRGASYVRNIEANPQVRVKIGRRWRAGRAHILLYDDPYARLEQLASILGRMRRLDAAILRAFVRWLETEPVTVRIDLDPPEGN
jgi:deazaflavin-dependent oxidoreductase (nitroreductase family)